MGRVKGSGRYVYPDGDSKHPHEWRNCECCDERYLGRLESRFCSLKCAGKVNGRQPRPAASRKGYLVCTKCDKEKPETQFDRHARSRGGRRAHCKACRAQEWQATKTPEILAARREYRREYAVVNRAYETARMAAWRQANPHAARAIGHRRRAQKKATAVMALSAALLAAKWEFWSGRCWMCGGEAVEWDHVKPLARGGSHLLANLRPACRSCNAHKSAHWPYQT